MKPAKSTDESSSPESTASLESNLCSALSRYLHDLSNHLWPVVVQVESALSGPAPDLELLSRVRNDVQEALNIVAKMSDLLLRPVVSDNDPDKCPTPLAQRTPQAPVRRLRILCVDGHPDAGATLAHMLKHLGHEVELLRTGAAALEAVALRAYDVVLTDIHLGDMSGRELTRRLRGCGPTPIIWLAGADVDAADDALLEPVVPNYILTKPLSLDALRKALAGYSGPATTSS